MENICFTSAFVLSVLIYVSQTMLVDRRAEDRDMRDEKQSETAGGMLFKMLKDNIKSDISVKEQSRVAAVLSVTNGGPWGEWGPRSFCADGSYAVGYKMKIEPKQMLGDDTSLNGIKLICGFLDNEFAGEADSTVGPWGHWVGPAKCNLYQGKPMYLTSFDLQVEQPDGDDTAANYVKFKCQDLCKRHRLHELVIPGRGNYGTWGAWSASCPKRTAICGIETKVEKPQEAGDDTALNDVKFYCCH